MRLRLLSCFAFCLFSLSISAQQYLDMIEAGTYTLSAIQQAAEAHFDIVGKGQGSGYKQFKRWEYVAQMELDNSGVKIPNLELAQRARDYRRAEKERQLAESGGFGGDWKQLGPTYKNATSGWNPGVGRITSIGIDISNTNHIIVGSPTGGVWKTLDGTNTWMPLTDNYSTVDVYCLEISPYNNNQYLWGSTSGRIFRSLDAGTTWAATGNATGSGRISRIQYHPTDPNVVYAVSESNGLFRSTNSGSTWTAVASATGTSGYDVEFKPGDPNTIYFSGRNVYRSTNGGTSFTQITGFGEASNNYKMMGVSPANPNFVYVLESNGGRFGAFYKSIDSGATFTKLVDGADINYLGYSATGDDDKGQAPRDMDVAVSLFNANEVHIAGIHTWKSTNGGISFDLTSYWTPATAQSLGVGYNHADIDLLKFVGNTLYVGSDGGIYTSTDGAATFVDRTPGLGIREFYKIGVSKTNPNVVSGGSQDNGTSVMRGANRQWVDWLGADGTETFVDWNNPNNLFGTSQNGSMYRSTNQGTSRSSISKPPNVDDGAWVTPFEQDPQVANTIYVAFADVWKTSNNGGLWTKISEFDNGNMSQMKLAPTDNQRIYVSRGSSLFTTGNGGTTWTTAASGWGTSSISYIAVHPLDPQRLLIVTSSGVYQSTNAGANWTNMSTGLPSGTKYCAAWENTGKNGIYVGGFGFISYTNDDLPGQWVGFFDGMPNCRVYELEINYVSNTVFAGTYGRGLWESPIYKALAPVAAFSADNRIGCQNLTVAFSDNSENSPTAWEWTFEGGTPATSTLKNPTVTYNTGGTFKVQLKSSNHVGDNTTEVLDYITVVSPGAPMVADVARCDSGAVSLLAAGLPGETMNWYASASEVTPMFSGDVFNPNIAQTTTFYVAAGTNIPQQQRVGPSSNGFGAGSDHAGNQFLIMDVEKPFRLKSAKVYATGAFNRVFQLRDANGVVLLEKSIPVSDGESRITLDMDIPQGIGLQIGCASPANLYRNSAGPSYPYSIGGLVSITTSSAGLDYYYYLYDLAVESNEWCESPRVPVTATVNTAPDAPAIAASGNTTLCPAESVELSTADQCPGCTINWSTGETGSNITISTDGIFTATLANTCGDSPASNAIEVSTSNLPDAPVVSAGAASALCLGESVALSVDNLCAGCTVLWSTGETAPSITVSSEGIYSATYSNACGDSPISNAITVAIGTTPDVAMVSASGPTTFCAGESVMLTVDDICVGCTVNWSTGETGSSIMVSDEGIYSATLHNDCGDGPVSNAISVMVGALPEAAVVTASGSTVVCADETVWLTAENVCPGCTVNWSTGETGPSISVSAEGLYSAIVTNACGDGPTSNMMAVTTVVLPDAAIVTASGPTTFCLGESVELTAENICPSCTIHWSTGETGPGITVSTEGVYTATLTNSCGDSPVSNAIEIATGDVPAAAMVTASGATTFCLGGSVELMADNVCAGCTVNWSNGETGASIIVSAEGNYTAKINNNCGDSPASNAITVTTNAVPDAAIVTASGPTTLCHGESIELMADLCMGCTVLWSTGETSPTISVSTDGLYTATLSNTCGDSPVSSPVAVTTGTVPTAPTISADGATTLCPGFTVVLMANNVCPGCTVSWSNGETGPSIEVSSSGLYAANVSDPNNNGCGDSPASNTIAVDAHEPFVLIVEVADLCHLTAPEGSNYQWYLNGVEIPGATGQLLTAAVTGEYVVSMQNPVGCWSLSVPVQAQACISSTQNLEGILSVRLYPNPATDRLFIDIDSERATSVQLELFSADGRFAGIVYQGDVLAGKQVLEVSLPALAAGMYWYRLSGGFGVVNGGVVVGGR